MARFHRMGGVTYVYDAQSAIVRGDVEKARRPGVQRTSLHVEGSPGKIISADDPRVVGTGDIHDAKVPIR